MSMFVGREATLWPRRVALLRVDSIRFAQVISQLTWSRQLSQALSYRYSYLNRGHFEPGGKSFALGGVPPSRKRQNKR
jgi:hypothetical protein